MNQVHRDYMKLLSQGRHEEAERLREEAEAAQEALEIAELEAAADAEAALEDAATDAYLQKIIDDYDATCAAEEKEWEDQKAAEKARKAAKKSRRLLKDPAVGKVMELRKVPSFTRIRIADWGSVEEVADDLSFAIDDVVVAWTCCEASDNPFAAVDIRGVVGTDGQLAYLPSNARAEIVEMPRFAGKPEELLEGVGAVRPPCGSTGGLVTEDGFHKLVWAGDPLFRSVQGWSDPELSVEVILCALHAAPEDDALNIQLLGALRARYADIRRRKSTYPPKQYPWRQSLDPSRQLLKFLRG